MQLKKQDIVIEIDPNGKEYVILKRDFMSKDCAGGLDGREFVNCGRVAAIKNLLSKLHPEAERNFSASTYRNSEGRKARLVLEEAAWTRGHWCYVVKDFQGRTAIETLYKILC